MSSLPDTVSVLDCPNGSKVYLVGTAHFSKESATDVQKTIQQVRPDGVVLELCVERQMILNMRDEDIMQQAKDLNWEKVRAFMASEGQVAGLTHAVFIKISANLMDKLGVAPGGEFRMGFQEGTKVGSTILLGDRSIRMTFKRALRALPIWQQLRLFYMLFTSVAFDLDISPEDIEKMKNFDMVEMLTGEL
ncbi:PREDICTED: traB domain-containing protein-like, partial [Amphimedon queenslandica]|uniref:TraB domain-containing protein n=1 Tax=Amphimedon queenslandica TaxID=400682 RepID=A0AAN0IJ63_AMPQE